MKDGFAKKLRVYSSITSPKSYLKKLHFHVRRAKNLYRPLQIFYYLAFFIQSEKGCFHVVLRLSKKSNEQFFTASYAQRSYKKLCCWWWCWRGIMSKKRPKWNKKCSRTKIFPNRRKNVREQKTCKKEQKMFTVHTGPE